MQRFVGRTVVAASVLVSVLGCADKNSCPAVCERATLTSRLVAGQVTFATGDEPPQTRTLAYHELGDATPDTCSVEYLQAEVSRNEFVNGVGPAVSCEFSPGYLWVGLHAVGDPRALSAGLHTLTPSPSQGFVEIQRAGCLTRGAGGLFTVDVTNATGGAAAYPTLVTTDYARDFTLHVEAVADNVIAGTDCAPTSVVLDLSLTQAASDAVFDPKAQCPCE